MDNQEILNILSPYLPHNLRVIDAMGRIMYLRGISLNAFGTLFVRLNDKDVCSGLPKLILRPLSDLIKVIELNGRRFIPMHRLKNGGTDLNEYRFLEWKGYSAIDNEEHETCYNPDNRSFNQYFMGDTRECRDQCSKFQNLFEWHFDVFGLIEKGLAIDINKLESEVQNELPSPNKSIKDYQ